MVAVEVNDLIKVFGKIRALDGLSCKVEEGEIYGLIGPNGAGKTTALRIIAIMTNAMNAYSPTFSICPILYPSRKVWYPL